MTHDNSYFDYLPDGELHPSSILPSLIGSGTQGTNLTGPNPFMFPSGYNSLTTPDTDVLGDIPKDEMLMGLGSGLFTGNFADFRQERHFIDVKGQQVPASAIDYGKPLVNDGFEGEGINKYYPSPTAFGYGTITGVDDDLSTNVGPGMSGILASYPPDSGGPEWSTYKGSRGSGIFNFKDFVANLGGIVSSGKHYAASGFNTFDIFNPYIHYYAYKDEVMQYDLGGEGDQIEVGGNEKYVSICRKHFYEKNSLQIPDRIMNFQKQYKIYNLRLFPMVPSHILKKS